MGKDPAFLFYSNDFLTGVSDLTFEERGQYITLLALQHQKGHLTEKIIKITVPNVSEDVLAKFSIDEDGKYYNERLEKESNKRAEHSKKQKERALKGWEKRKNRQSRSSTTADAAALPLENENVNKDVNKIVDYLNNRVGSNYKASTKKTKDLIKARIKDGFGVEDFKTVIDKKADEWENDKEFCKYLRPETLFGNKFESYLNQQQAKPDREEQLNIHLLKHLRDVQSDNYRDEPTDNNRVRRIS